MNNATYRKYNTFKKLKFGDFLANSGKLLLNNLDGIQSGITGQDYYDPNFSGEKTKSWDKVADVSSGYYSAATGLAANYLLPGSTAITSQIANSVNPNGQQLQGTQANIANAGSALGGLAISGIPNSSASGATPSSSTEVVNKKCGGYMNKRMDAGGQLTGIPESAGTHEQNPMGGVNLDGFGASVEGGEMIDNESNYVFSDSLYLDKVLVDEFGLPKQLIGKSFSKAMETMKSKFPREHDKMDKESLAAVKKRMITAQESYKEKMDDDLTTEFQQKYSENIKKYGGKLAKQYKRYDIGGNLGDPPSFAQWKESNPNGVPDEYVSFMRTNYPDVNISIDQNGGIIVGGTDDIITNSRGETVSKIPNQEEIKAFLDRNDNQPTQGGLSSMELLSPTNFDNKYNKVTDESILLPTSSREEDGPINLPPVANVDSALRNNIRSTFSEEVPFNGQQFNLDPKSNVIANGNEVPNYVNPSTLPQDDNAPLENEPSNYVEMSSGDLKSTESPSVDQSNPNVNESAYMAYIEAKKALRNKAAIEGMRAAPIAYNLVEGLRKEDRLNFENYRLKNRITPYKYNERPELENIRTGYTDATNNLRNASGGNSGTYLSNVGNVYAKKSRAIGELYGKKYNVDAQADMNAQTANIDVDKINATNNMYIDDWNMRSKQSKRDNLQEGAVRLAQMGNVKAQEAFYDTLGQLEAPGFYNPQTQAYAKLIKDKRAAKAKYKSTTTPVQ
jgi:hypothetical protein